MLCYHEFVRRALLAHFESERKVKARKLLPDMVTILLCERKYALNLTIGAHKFRC